MYPLSNNIKTLFEEHSRQVIRITFTDNSIRTITEADIIQGSLSVDRYTMSNNRIEIGSAIASELNFKLQNYNGQWDDTVFEGKEVYVEIGTKDWTDDNATVTYVPMGYFIIDTPPRTLRTISIAALDRMVLLDQYVDWEDFTYPVTGADFIDAIETDCGVTINVKDNTNLSAQVCATAPVSMVTYRTVLQWVAFINGSCAWVDRNGEINLSWYDNTGAAYTSTPAKRYSSDLHENTIEITGLVYTVGGAEHINGTTEYPISYTGCEILQTNIDTVLPAIYNKVVEFEYRPLEATVKPCPWVDVFDPVVYTDKDGNDYDTFITHITFTANGNTKIAGKGDTATNVDYVMGSGLTVQEVQALAEAVSGAVGGGLYQTQVIQQDQSVIYYLHDRPALNQSMVIVTIDSLGMRFSNDGGTTTSAELNFVTGQGIYNAITAGAAWIENLFAQDIEVSGVLHSDDYEGSTLPLPSTLNPSFPNLVPYAVSGMGLDFDQKRFATENVLIDELGRLHCVAGEIGRFIIDNYSLHTYGVASITDTENETDGAYVGYDGFLSVNHVAGATRPYYAFARIRNGKLDGYIPRNLVDGTHDCYWMMGYAGAALAYHYTNPDDSTDNRDMAVYGADYMNVPGTADIEDGLLVGYYGHSGSVDSAVQGAGGAKIALRVANSSTKGLVDVNRNAWILAVDGSTGRGSLELGSTSATGASYARVANSSVSGQIQANTNGVFGLYSVTHSKFLVQVDSGGTIYVTDYYYTTGNSFSLGGTNFLDGFLTSAGTRLCFIIPISRKLLGSGVAATALTLAIRHVDGGYAYARSGTNGGTYTPLSSDVAIMNNSTFVRSGEISAITCAIVAGGIRVMVDFTYALTKASGSTTGVTNNTPVALQVGGTFRIT